MNGERATYVQRRVAHLPDVPWPQHHADDQALRVVLALPQNAAPSRVPVRRGTREDDQKLRELVRIQGARPRSAASTEAGAAGLAGERAPATQSPSPAYIGLNSSTFDGDL